MYKLRNKQTGVEVFALGFLGESVANKDPLYPTLVPIWKDFLNDTPFFVENLNWSFVLKLYESITVRETMWVIRNQEGFYFPIRYKLLIELYDFVGTKPDEFWNKYK